MAEEPAGLVPIRLATTVFSDDPASADAAPRVAGYHVRDYARAPELFSPIKFPGPGET